MEDDNKNIYSIMHSHFGRVENRYYKPGYTHWSLYMVTNGRRKTLFSKILLKFIVFH